MKAPEELLAEVGTAAEAVDRARQELRSREAVLYDAMRAAVNAGCPSTEVARVSGVSKQRVSQVAPARKGTKPRETPGKSVVAAVRVMPADTVRTLPATGTATLSGLASTRKRARYGMPTVFLDSRQGSSLPAILAAAHDEPGERVRVFLAGPAPVDTSTGATHAEAVRAWALGDPGEGWRADTHYLADADKPTLRFTHLETGKRVTIMRAAAWFNDETADAALCRAAWERLGAVLEAVPAFAGAGLADTAATTGRALWLRTIPEGRSFPVLSDELRELLRSTSGQGRVELLPAPHAEAGGTSPLFTDFTVMDGRIMYAALTWGLPVGEPKRWTRAEVEHLTDEDAERVLRGRGRWRITATVPGGWAHVGLLMAPGVGGSWVYPRQPGERFTTWADGSEVWLARRQGWRVEVHEGITWAEGKPLDQWTKLLVGCWEQAKAAQAAGAPEARLVAAALRNLIIHAIGAFAGNTHDVTRSCSITDDPDVPAGTEVRRVGERLVWDEPGAAGSWASELAHPEWSSTVWARARTRLLEARGAEGQTVGALHVPFDSVVSFATDALYLAGGAPAWGDDGRPGRFRTKGTRPGLFTWPADRAALYTLRDEAETTGGN